MNKFKAVLLFILVIVLFILSGFKLVDYKKETAIITLKHAYVEKIQDQPDTAYTDLTVKRGKKTYHLVIHDIYIYKHLVYQGYYYNIEYRNHQLWRPDMLVETLEYRE